MTTNVTENKTTVTAPTNDAPANDWVRFIKRSLRGVMNGPVSASMREKGLTYKVNFGVELPRLTTMATEWPKRYDLAAALWKEDIRECRLLAAMLMPTEAFDGDLADIWVEQMRFTEEAEGVTMHLFARLPEASQKAFEWMAREERMFRLCGFLLIGRLLMKAGLTERDANEFLDQAEVAIHEAAEPGDDRAVARAAYKAVLKYESVSGKSVLSI